MHNFDKENDVYFVCNHIHFLNGGPEIYEYAGHKKEAEEYCKSIVMPQQRIPKKCKLYNYWGIGYDEFYLYPKAGKKIGEYIFIIKHNISDGIPFKERGGILKDYLG